MKKYILIIISLFFLSASKAQTVSCNYTFNQSGSTVSFFLPLYPLIYSVDSVDWVFGDGTHSFQSGAGILFPTVHNYTAPGTYTACLNIWLTQIGVPTVIFCTSCQPIIISGGPAPCNASYIFTQSGANVNFASTSSGPGTITGHAWNFGDGSPVSTATNPAHTYATSGSYSVCHSITGTSSTGSFSCTFCDTVIVTLGSPCNASFNTIQTGNIVNFTSTSTGPGPITSHLWVFGDATPNSTAANPIHTYTNPGNYTACHTISGSATGGGSFSCTTCDTITISGTPCTANANFTQVATGSSVAFTSTSTCTGCVTTTYGWNFGDGSLPSTATNPTHVYAATGVYNVCLLVSGTTSSGTFCLDTMCKNVTVTVPSGVGEIELNHLTIYPNPVSDRIYIKPHSSMKFNNGRLTISDIAGRKVQLNMFSRKSNEDISVNIDNLQPGIYFIKLTDEDGQHFTGNFIKK